jgi:hypothetical protein
MIPRIETASYGIGMSEKSENDSFPVKSLFLCSLYTVSSLVGCQTNLWLPLMVVRVLLAKNE